MSVIACPVLRQRGASLLRPGEMSVTLDSPAGRARVSQVRLRHSTPINTVIMFVPQQEVSLGDVMHVMGALTSR